MDKPKQPPRTDKQLYASPAHWLKLKQIADREKRTMKAQIELVIDGLK